MRFNEMNRVCLQCVLLCVASCALVSSQDTIEVTEEKTQLRRKVISTDYDAEPQLDKNDEDHVYGGRRANGMKTRNSRKGSGSNQMNQMSMLVDAANGLLSSALQSVSTVKLSNLIPGLMLDPGQLVQQSKLQAPANK